MNFRQFLESLEGLDVGRSVKGALDNVDWSSDEWSYAASIDLGDDEDLDPEDIETRAYELATEEFEDRFYDLQYTFEQLGASFEVFRVITVPGQDYEELLKAIQTNKVGEYWSWDENAAEAHWGTFSSGYQKITLGAKVQQNQVNWEDTMIVNINSPEEKEIRLKEGTRVEINGVEFEGRWYPANIAATV